MTQPDWRARAGATFACEKRPAHGARGMVVTNHPLASAAGAEMLAAGGNAIDAAIAACFTLTVVEPMMVGILGGGMAHLRLADGTPHGDRRPEHRAAGDRPDDLHARSRRAAPGTMETIGRKNALGPTAVAAPGNLMAWCETLARFGTFSLADVMEPAIRHASRGFRVTPYLLRMRRRLRRRHGARRGDRRALPARRRADHAGHAAGHRRLCRDAARDRAATGRDLLYGGALGRHYADAHGAARRLPRDGGPDRLPHRDARARCAAPIAATRSSARRRRRPARCTSSRC